MKKIILLIMILMISLHLFSYSYGKNKIQREKLKWSKIETLHFDIYFNEGDDVFGQIMALLSEEAYYHINKDLKIPIRNRVPLIFYKSHQDFETTNIISPLLNEGVGGFTEISKNRVAVPFDGSFKKMEETLVHELTHAYVNEINRSGSNLLSISRLPFWFSEGMPEFESVGGTDVYNNMFIIDLVMNDGIADLSYVGGYYAYRLGEGFLVYLAEEYGRESVADLFYALRISSTSDEAFERVFDLPMKDVQTRWETYLKRKYFRYIEEFKLPYEVYEQLTDHEKDGSNYNYAPRFSPDGKKYLYFTNRNINNDIYLGSTFGLSKNKEIISGESTGRFEEFHFQKNNISWFPDNNRFAFVSKTSYGDHIYIYDVHSKDLIYKFGFPQFDAIFEIDVSHDGEQIVFAGQDSLKTDLYIFNIATEKLSRLTDDFYYDSQPRWSPDDSKIAFTSERDSLETALQPHVFSNMKRDIYYYDFAEAAFYQVTDDQFNNEFPIWDAEGEHLIFISERSFASNFETIHLNSGKRAKITNTLGGVFTGDMNNDNSKLIFSGFYQGAWDIYLLENPLLNLEFADYHLPVQVDIDNDMFMRYKLDRYKLFGKRERNFPREEPSFARKYHTRIDLRNQTEPDSLGKKPAIDPDAKPEDIKEPEISSYKTKFYLDTLWGGLAYSSSGTYAQVQLGLSDLMGNHGIGLNLGVSGEIENSNFLIQYVYLANRIDYGLGVFYLNDETIYQISYVNSDDNDYFRKRERDYGLYGLISYPLNKFWRIEVQNIFRIDEVRHDWWNDNSGEWIEEFLPDDFQDQFGLKEFDDEMNWVPQVSFVHDNAIYGSTGPMLGWKGAFMVNRTLSNENKGYSLIYGDVRSYTFFAKRFAWANRIFGGALLGDTDDKFELDYYSGIRGYDEDDEGSKKLIASTEFRFPMIDNLNFAFPFPLYFYGIRGSAFIDIGAVWDNEKDFVFYEDEVLQDVKMGVGFGPRINVGYFVVKLDVAWNTNLYNASKPTYYISLSPDF